MLFVIAMMLSVIAINSNDAISITRMLLVSARNSNDAISNSN